MKYEDILFEPLSDIGVNEKEELETHNKKINNGNYNDAASVTEITGKGFTASLFNSIRNKIRVIELMILNEFVADEGEYFSYNAPNEEEMPKGTEVFIQLF